MTIERQTQFERVEIHKDRFRGPKAVHIYRLFERNVPKVERLAKEAAQAKDRAEFEAKYGSLVKVV